MTHDMDGMTDREAIEHIHAMLDVDVSNMSLLVQLVKEQGKAIRKLSADLDTQLQLITMMTLIVAPGEDSPPPSASTLGSGGEAEAGS